VRKLATALASVGALDLGARAALGTSLLGGYLGLTGGTLDLAMMGVGVAGLYSLTTALEDT
jgi:hypothetical protein